MFVNQNYFLAKISFHQLIFFTRNSFSPKICLLEKFSRKFCSSKDKPTKITTGWNCQKSQVSPMPGQCMAEEAIYGATVKETISGKMETYTGLSKPPIKKRFEGHLSTFKHKNSDHTSQ